MLKQRVAANLISNYLLTFISLAMGFVLVPFLIGKLGKEPYGLIVLAESTILIFEVLAISVRMALSRHAAFALAQNKKDEFVQYLATGRTITYVTSAVVLALSLVLSGSFPVIFRVPAELATESRLLFLAIGSAFSFTILTSIYWSTLYAHQRFDLINIASSGGLIVRAVSIFICFSFLPPGYITLSTYGVLYLAMIVADNSLVRFWQKRLMPDLKIRFSDYRRDKLRDILAFSMYSSLSRVSAVLNDSTSNILINRFWGPGANALYSIALKFPVMMEKIFVNAAWSLTPVFTDLVARGEKEQFKRLYFLYTKFITILTTPLALVLVFISGPLIRFWVGPEFDTAGRIMPIIMAPLFISIPYSVSGCITNAYGKVKLPSQLYFASAVLNVLLGIFLGRVMGMGLTGIAIASALTSFAYVTFFLTSYACRISGLPFLEYSLKAFLQPFAGALSIVGGAFLAIRWAGFEPAIGLPLALFSSLVLLANFAFAYGVILSRDERSHVRDVLKGLFSKIGITFSSDAQNT